MQAHVHTGQSLQGLADTGVLSLTLCGAIHTPELSRITRRLDSSPAHTFAQLLPVHRPASRPHRCTESSPSINHSRIPISALLVGSPPKTLCFSACYSVGLPTANFNPIDSSSNTLLKVPISSEIRRPAVKQGRKRFLANHPLK